jgi:hypothetical protein
MGDKGGKKDKDKQKKQHDKKTQGKEQRQADKTRPPAQAPLARQAQAAARQG